MNAIVEVTRREELLDALGIAIKEAGSRNTAQDAVRVMAGVLTNLADDFPELRELSVGWVELSSQHKVGDMEVK